MTIDMKDRMIYLRKLEKYLSEYGYLYSAGAREEIEENFLNPYDKIREASDVLNQVYEYVGVFEKEKDNAYDIFINNMTRRMNINRELLEVGCGYYPSLAKRIAKLQNYGSVTAIDPKVVTTNVTGIKVIKSKLSENIGIENFAMLYGLYPCEATIDMIKLASIYDKDLCILACDCCDTPFGELPNITLWLKYIEVLLEDSLPYGRDFDIEIIKSLDAPLITTKKL